MSLAAEEREERGHTDGLSAEGQCGRVAADPHRSLHGPVRVARESGEGSGSEEEGNALQRREKELVKGVDVAAGFAHSLILAHSGQFSTRVVFSSASCCGVGVPTRCLERNGCLSQ